MQIISKGSKKSLPALSFYSGTVSKPTLCSEESFFLFWGCWLYKYPWNRSLEPRAINASAPKYIGMQEITGEGSLIMYSKPILPLNTGLVPSQLLKDILLLSPSSISFYYTLSLWHIVAFFSLQFLSHFSAYLCRKTVPLYLLLFSFVLMYQIFAFSIPLKLPLLRSPVIRMIKHFFYKTVVLNNATGTLRWKVNLPKFFMQLNPNGLLNFDLTWQISSI